MAAIVNTGLSGFTVTYNGVQFGGNDGAYPSYPPMYDLRLDPVYDESGRTIIWNNYTLTVRCIFFAATEAAMAANRQAITTALSVPGKQLKIQGLGTGLGLIQRTGGQALDIANGPKPQPAVWTSHGQATWELSWIVTFSIAECVSYGNGSFDLSTPAFVAFNFSTTWQNDFEGITRRTISGHVIVPQARDYTNAKAVLVVAERTRGNIIVSTPTGFKRTQNSWSESQNKQRLDFSITDELLQGDALPPGVTIGNAAFDFSTDNLAMSQGTFSFNMTIKTALNVDRMLAGRIFMIAAMAKQADIVTQMAAQYAADQALPADQRTMNDTMQGVIIPLKLQLRNQKWDDCRVTSGAIAWRLTQTLGALLNATKIWEPMSTYLTGLGGSQDYTQWRASMTSLWDNRALAQIGSTPSEAVIIDICDNVTTKTIGVTGSTPNNITPSSLYSLSCPSADSKNGWIYFDLSVDLYVKGNQTTHRRAATYLPGAVQDVAIPTDPTAPIPTGMPSGSSPSANDQHIIENHGYPEVLVGIKYRAIRYGIAPQMPNVVSVGGFGTIIHQQSQSYPKRVGDVFGCPVWSMTGWRVYKVTGGVPTLTPLTRKSIADPAAPIAL